MGCHFGWEDTWCDGVDPDLDTLGGDLGGKEFGEVVGSTFGCVVGKVVLSALYHAGDGAGPRISLTRRAWGANGG